MGDRYYKGPWKSGSLRYLLLKNRIMYKVKLSPEEALETIKLRMKYDSSKTLTENVGIIKEQKSDEEFNEDDFEFPIGEFRVIVDAMSMQYLQGAEIDYKEDLQGSSFSIKNPNAQSTCGCGSSFSI